MRWLLVFVVACGSSAASPEADRQPLRAQHAVPSADQPTKSAGKLYAHWGNVKTVASCFYFSGPNGRDDRLVGEVVVQRDNGRLTVRIANATFEGTYTKDEVVLTRQSQHEFGGAWHVTETIRGKFVEAGFEGRYHYNECELDSGNCPGRCTIDADLAFRK